MLMLSFMMSACSLSAKKIKQVDQQVNFQREQQINCPGDPVNKCSADSPLLELARENTAASRNHVTLLEVGEDALKIRVHLIRAARDNIDIQNFILRRDDTGELFLNELLNAARRGVKVRLLLDQMFTVSDLDYLVRLTFAHQNFEIKFYNPSFNKAEMEKHDWISAVACCFRRFNQRMHNKMIVVDGLIGVIGGRNIADRYFDFDTNYDFKDRDVAVMGATALDMHSSFEVFWQYKKSIPIQHLRDVAGELLDGAETELEPFIPSPRLFSLLEQTRDQAYIRATFIDTAFEIENLEYFSDWPRKTEHPEYAQPEDITLKLHNLLLSAKESIVIQSPYMVLSNSARRLFRDLKEENPSLELVFSTNSLASTDADTVYANTHKHKKRYVKRLGFLMYEFKPFPMDAPIFFPRWSELIKEKKQGVISRSTVSGDDSTVAIPAPRVGLHSKSFVVDGKVAMIGSHNFDPRSEGFNTENGLIIWDEKFAKKLESLIRRDIEPQNSWIVAMRPDEETESALDHGEIVNTQTKSEAWYYGSTSVFELIPGKERVTPDSPDFYNNYYAVGSFPEVITTRRQITVLFLSSFFGFLEPIL